MYPGTVVCVLSVKEVGTKKVSTNLTEPSMLGTTLVGDPFRIHIKRKKSERKKQGVKLGYMKWSKTGNKIDKLKELKKHDFKFKSNIKYLKKKVTQGKYNYEVYDNEKPKDAGDQFGGKKSKKNSRKID